MKKNITIIVLSSLLIIGLSSFFYGGDKKAVDPIIKAKIIKVIDGGLKLRVCLINSSDDTLCYRSESCTPFIDNIEFSPSLFDLNLRECFFSNPIKLQIAPHGAMVDTIDVYADKKNMDYYGRKFKLGYHWIPLSDTTKNMYNVNGATERIIWSDTL